MSRRPSQGIVSSGGVGKASQPPTNEIPKNIGATFLGKNKAHLDLSLLKAIPLLHEKGSQGVNRGLLQGVFKYMQERDLFDGDEGESNYRKFATNLIQLAERENGAKLALEEVNLLFTGLFVIVQRAVMSKMDSKKIVEHLKLAQVPEVVADDIGKALVKSRLPIEKISMQNRVGCAHLKSFRWRVDVAISSGSLSRVMMPTLLFQMTLSDGKIWTFEVSVQQFNQLRYGVAKMLQDMGVLERHPVMRMENEEEQKRLVAMEKGRGEDLQGK